VGHQIEWFKLKERRKRTMACITLFAPRVAMATTQLARVIHCEGVSTPQLVSNVERNSLRMSWVVVTDSAGDRHLQNAVGVIRGQPPTAL
jgi:hypothetical protein